MNSLAGWQVVVAALTLLGGAGGVAAFVRVFTDRPKVRADAVKTITEASATSSAASAAAVVALAARLERVEKKADSQGRQLDEQDHQIGRLTDYVDRVSGWSTRHEPYDAAARMVAADHGVTLPPIELFPKFDGWHPTQKGT